MRLTNPIESLASSLHHAALVAFPDIPYETRDWSSSDRTAMRHVQRRPMPEECKVYAMFAETWGSTALGFGGLGGAAMTPAYTVVIEGPGGEYAVYWHGRFAYLVTLDTPGRAQFLADVHRQVTASRRDAVERYGLGQNATDDSDD